MRTVTKSISAQNTFTDAISTNNNLAMYRQNIYGHLALSISGTWSGTVTVQRSFDNGSNWQDIDSFTTNIETAIKDPTDGVLYRAGIKTGDYTSGAAVVGLYQ